MDAWWHMIHALVFSVVLQFVNVARVPDATLERAQREVAAIYRSAGVDIEWADADGPLDRPVVRVVLELEERGSLRQRPNAIMGVAVRAAQGSRVAYVFYRQVERLAAEHDVSAAQVLACTIAHEIGHLLLPGEAHAREGLMRGSWDRGDFRRADRGLLRFSPEESARIRERVEEATTFDR